MKIKVVFDPAESGKRFPLFCRYSNESAAQEAFISLCLDTGEVDADYSGEIGNGVPSPVWNRRVLRFSINASIYKDEIITLIDSLLHDLQMIMDHANIEWDGMNMVGVFDEDALNAIERVNMLCIDREVTTFMFEPSEMGQHMHNLGPLFPEPGQSVEEFAKSFHDDDGMGDVYFSDEMNSIDSIRKVIEEVWLNDLYSDEKLPAHIAQYLLDQYLVEDDWKDEALAMASGSDQ